MTDVIEVTTATPDETQALGATFGALLTDGDFVSLQGDLGAGKTLFAKGVAASLGCDPNEVASPTFTLAREYQGRMTLYHLDIYRLEDPEDELIAIGYEEFFEPEHGVTLVEWGELAEGLLPKRRFEVHILKLKDARRVRISGIGQTQERLETMQRAFASQADLRHRAPGDGD